MAVTTLTISGLYLLAQLIAAGSLFKLLSGMPFEWAVALTAVLVVIYVAVVGMLATTWVQVIKACLLLTVLGVLSVMLAIRIGGDWTGFVEGAATSGKLDPLAPGNLFGSGWNTLSTGLALALGVVPGLLRTAGGAVRGLAGGALDGVVALPHPLSGQCRSGLGGSGSSAARRLSGVRGRPVAHEHAVGHGV
jgi:Na+(H+)/acetate symporter ActP